jgi:hypothetical protein
VDGHSHVAEDRLGPRGRHDDRLIGVWLAGRLVQEVVADRPQRTGLRCGNDLQIAHARPASGAPVDQRLRPIREAVAVETLEGHADRFRRALVHRVAQPAPVGRRAHPPLLGEHHGLRGVGEGAHALEIALAAERLAALAFLRDDPVENELGGDAGMVQAGQEQRPVAAHASVADHEILDRGPLGVAQVQGAGDVRRRLDDRERRQVGIGRGTGAIRREHVGRQPALVGGAFDVARCVGLRQIGHRFVCGSWNENARPSSGRAGRGTTCWFGIRSLAFITLGVSRCPLDALSGVVRRGSRATFMPAIPRGSHRPALAPEICPTLLFSVVAVRAGV